MIKKLPQSNGNNLAYEVTGKVTMEDAFEAERIFSLLMGDDVDPRRAYIEKYAATVKDLDI